MRFLALCTLLYMMVGAPLVSAQSHRTAAFEILPDELEPSVVQGTARISLDTGIPLAVYRTAFTSSVATPEGQANEYLEAHANQLGFSSVREDLKHVATRETPGGYRVRYEQHAMGHPVYQGGVAVSLDHTGRVLYVVNGYKPLLKPAVFAAKMSTGQAQQIARQHLQIAGIPASERVETVWYYRKGETKLVHQVHLFAPATLSGYWEVLVDAQTGTVIKAWNRARSHKTGQKAQLRTQPTSNQIAMHTTPSVVAPNASQQVDGVGFVFDPDPLSATRSMYEAGGAYGDNGDADSPALTNARVQVTLPDITLTGTTYSLAGPYAVVTDWDMPNKGVFSQDTGTWDFTREHDAFEAANVYYHIDKAMRYINETLGFSLMPYQYSGGVRIDAHGAGGEDQSFYAGGSLTMGEGGVDDAEDAHVTWHELGHGLHDWLTNGQVSTRIDLGEGIGDYWAMSYTRSLGQWTPEDPQYQWVFVWDGHNEYWDGRQTDYTGHYPEDLIDGAHTDGQMWSSSLMQIYDQIGREATDRLFLEALSMTGQNSTQQDAAFAFLQADQALFNGDHAAVIFAVFSQRGYIDGNQAQFAASVNSGPPALTVAFNDMSILPSGNPATSWAWDFDNNGTVDATDANPTWTYELPGLYSVRLTASDGNEEATAVQEDLISVNAGVYVWEGQRGQTDYSGAYVNDYLTNNNYPTAYTRTAQIHTSLVGYDAVFLSFGQFGSFITALDGAMANTVLEYLQSGGNVYLEGSDVLGFDQASNPPFLGAFGLASADDGTEGNTPVRQLVGQINSITEGMIFTSSSQQGTTYIDKYTPSVTGIASLVEEGYGTVAVQNQGVFGQKTFASAYTLASLTDSDLPNTRATLMERILTFFEVSPGQATAQEVPDASLPQALSLAPPYPNPFHTSTTISFTLPVAQPISIRVYNTLGQEVAQLMEEKLHGIGTHQVEFVSHDLPSGLYLIRLETNTSVSQENVLLIR